MRKACVLAFLFVLVAAGVAFAQQADIPLRNWTVPPYTASSGGIHTMVDATPPRVFVGLQVCRLLDTRPPANNPLDGDGAFSADQTRTYDLDGQCGIPAGADAVSLNITVTNTGNNPFGHVKIWPANQAEPNVSTLNWSTGGVTVANAAIVALSPTGTLSVKTGNAGADVIIDTNGYFSDTLTNGQNYLALTNNSTLFTAYFTNNSGTCTGFCGVVADVASGIALAGTSPNNFGVYGSSTSNVGVKGVSGSYNGLWGESSTQDGIFGSGGRDGAYIQGARHGVLGTSLATTGLRYGVSGAGLSNDIFSAGVHGTTNQVGANGGAFENTAVGAAATAYISFQGGGVNYGFSSVGRIFGGSLTISPGPKNFAAPHPEDPGLEIRYASVEAPTVDVYFRGTAELVNGIGRVEVPDHFRFTAREGTYMTTLTPVGRAVTLSVESEGPEGIVVRGTGNARFHYVVYAERAEIEGFQPVIKNELFTPEMLAKGNRVDTLPAPTKALLIRNGTLHPDGTFNVETARAQGWVIPERPQPPAAQQP